MLRYYTRGSTAYLLTKVRGVEFEHHQLEISPAKLPLFPCGFKLDNERFGETLKRLNIREKNIESTLYPARILITSILLKDFIGSPSNVQFF
jgi:hypothetical protein